jgi:tetratricopeptide (TPR) repeat protein
VTVRGTGAPRPLDPLVADGDLREAEVRAATHASERPDDRFVLLGQALLARRAVDAAAEAKALLALAARAPRDPLGLVALRRLTELCDESPELARAVDAGLAPLLASGRLEGIAAYRARVARVAAAEVLGDHARAGALRAENGAIRAWTLAGPFGRRRAVDFVAAWPADGGVLPASVPAPFDGSARPSRPIPAPDGGLVLDGEPFGADVFYLAADVTLARGGRYLLSLGTALSVRVSIDGVAVHERRDFAAYLPTVLHVPVELAPGVHRVLLKVARAASWSGLYVAFAREDGAPSDATAAPVAPGARPPAAPRPAFSAPVHGAAALADALAPAAGRPLAALLAGIDAASVDREGAKALLAEAVAALPRSSLARVAHALVVASDGSLDEQVARARAEAELRDALARDPGHLGARLSLASLLRRAGRLDEADALVAAVPPQDPRLPASPAREAALALSRARGAEARGHLEAAEDQVAAAIAGGAGCRALELGRDLASRRRAVALEDERARALASCRDGRERLAEHLRRRGDLAGAVDALAPLVAARPWAVEPTLALAAAHVAAGEAARAAQVLERLRETWPRSARVEKRLAEALELAGDLPAARAARERALRADPGDLSLRRRLAFEDGRDPLDDWAEDAVSAIRAYEAARPRRTDDTSSTLVLDAAAVEFHRGGGYTERTHQVIHVLDPQGVEQFGEVSIPAGAEVLALRTIKPDGRALEPERITRDGKGTVSLAGLEPGDYVRLEWIRSDRGLGATIAADPFFFRSGGTRMFLSRYVATAPVGLGLVLDAHGVDAPAPTREGGYEVFRVAARDVPAHVREPAQPPLGEVLPHVQAGLAGERDEVQKDLADFFPQTLRATEELRAFARGIRAEAGKDAGPAALARAAWARVSREILGAGDEGFAASESLSRGRGNRLVVLQAVLGELGVRSRIAFARPFSSDPTPRRFASHTLWSYPLLRIEAGGETIWHDPSLRIAPLGTLPAAVLGVEALVVPLPGEPLEVARTPERAAVEDRREGKVRIVLAPDGSAEVEGEDRFLGASAASAKAAIERLDAAERRQVVEAMLARTFRGLTLATAEIAGEDDPSAPFALRWKGTVSGLARVGNGGLVLDAPLLPARLGARWVQVATRTTPLLIPVPDRAEQRIELVAPPGFLPEPAPPFASDGPYGSFARTERAEGRSLIREEHLVVRRGRIPPSEYPDFASFATAVDRQQQAPTTLRKGEVADVGPAGSAAPAVAPAAGR